MRINFNQIFTIHTDGAIEPKQQTRIGGIEFGPGARFGRGASLAGIDLTEYTARDMEIDIDKGVVVIKGIY